ncbi:acyl carrier protein [Pseudomonas fluorescens]|uniref:Acyl carrier protein n=1 Tax=Pseudomonas fluorescens TaxID=294 RepID=A0A5E7EA19_PSEFL|nr:acyl carrier protein [Pseudomonas fluorescens]VVO23574.1 Acyl carrier protein [Pseudomonas fluorescens]
MSDIDARVKKMVAEQLGVEECQIAGEMPLVEELYANFLDGVDLATALENEFGIFIPGYVIPYMNTVQDVIAYVQANHKAQRRPRRRYAFSW